MRLSHPRPYARCGTCVRSAFYRPLFSSCDSIQSHRTPLVTSTSECTASPKTAYSSQRAIVRAIARTCRPMTPVRMATLVTRQLLKAQPQLALYSSAVLKRRCESVLIRGRT